jgi:FkbM family methyltransferase
VRFVSYAQNFEDVMLWRALGSVGHGFYIDVGAEWPTADSVTRAFYDRGWSGVNIEPNPRCFDELASARDRDINLNVALAEGRDTRQLFVVENTGLSTLHQDIASEHARAGFVLAPVQVDTCTLSDVWDEHVGGREVHFLKIDVEGSEQLVLRGNDWHTNRPWIVVIESTRPNSPIENFSEWEHILVEADYDVAYQDGLNRFYVAREREELRSKLKFPPNPFDNFVPFRQVQLQELLDDTSEQFRATAERLQAVSELHERVIDRLQASASQLTAAELRITDLTAQSSLSERRIEELSTANEQYVRQIDSMATALQQRAEEADAAQSRVSELTWEVECLRRSTSWRVTSPLRLIGHGLKRLVRARAGSVP